MPQTRNVVGQVQLEGSFDLHTSADEALLFFTPEGERAWVEGWNPKPVYPPQSSVAFQPNAVFRIDKSSECSIWTILQANLNTHIAEYVYVVEGERLTRVHVELEAIGTNRSRVRVRYVHTALSEKGAEFVSGLSKESFVQKMQDWQRTVTDAIQHSHT